MESTEKRQHVKALEKETLLLSLLVSALSAVICMQIISRIGITRSVSFSRAFTCCL